MVNVEYVKLGVALAAPTNIRSITKKLHSLVNGIQFNVLITRRLFVFFIPFTQLTFIKLLGPIAVRSFPA